MWRMSREYCSCCLAFTATEQVFVTGHLSRQPLGPGQYVAFVPGPTASRASVGDRGLLSRLEGGLLSRLVAPTGTKGRGLLFRLEPPTLLSRLVSPTGTKGPCPPAGPASRWTRDKSHILSWAQRLPGQMACYKGLFCSSASYDLN